MQPEGFQRSSTSWTASTEWYLILGAAQPHGEHLVGAVKQPCPSSPRRGDEEVEFRKSLGTWGGQTGTIHTACQAFCVFLKGTPYVRDFFLGTSPLGFHNSRTTGLCTISSSPRTQEYKGSGGSCHLAWDEALTRNGVIQPQQKGHHCWFARTTWANQRRDRCGWDGEAEILEYGHLRASWIAEVHIPKLQSALEALLV